MVRLATAADLPRICMIRRQVHQIHVDGRPDVFKMPQPLELFDQLLYDCFGTDDFFLFVCEDNEVITGYAQAQRKVISPTPVKQARKLFFIDEFGVDENHRQQGYGKELMHAIIAYAKEAGMTSVDLDVWGFNEHAEAFYRSLGMTTKQTFLELPLI